MMVDIRIAKVVAASNSHAGEWSMAIAPGLVVDFNHEIVPGIFVRDVFPEEFFEPRPPQEPSGLPEGDE